MEEEEGKDKFSSASFVRANGETKFQHSGIEKSGTDLLQPGLAPVKVEPTSKIIQRY